MQVIEEIEDLFEQQGNSLYAGEVISQREHALQTATLAENEDASPVLIAAALLHDIGHLLHDLPEDSAMLGVDDRHESLGETYVQKIFGSAVAAPVRLHVAAKRYLCAAESDYLESLSDASRLSLRLQGGPFTASEMIEFEDLSHWQNAVRVRRWDDCAKVEGMVTPSVQHFSRYLREVLEMQKQ